jgi:regulator of sigma E protease
MIDIVLNNILPFIVILTILVFVHELGHYLVAIFNGVKVEVFSIGFGRELFGYTDKYGTRWKFSLVPLGGYVKMHGDLDEASSKKKPAKNINPEESFHEKSILQRSMILFAGPAANFIFSFILLVSINIFFGISIDKPIVSYVEKDRPAFNSGMKIGDIILEVDNTKIEKFSQLKEIVISKNNEKIKVTFSRDNKIEETVINVVDSRIGVRGTVEIRKLNFFDSCVKSTIQLAYFVKATLIGIFEILTGSRGVDDLGGPIRIAELSADFWSKGVHSTLWFMMIISLNLGLINLFPIPMLDGGHLVLNLFEFINGAPLKDKYLEIAHTFGFVLLISLMVFATYNDIARFFE